MSALDKLNNKAISKTSTSKKALGKLNNKAEKKSSVSKSEERKPTETPKIETAVESEKAVEVVQPKEDKPREEVAKSVQSTVTAEPTTVKRGPGKPKKRKPGDRRVSFWLEEDLVEGLYSTLKYGESASDLINDMIREYQIKHNSYKG